MNRDIVLHSHADRVRRHSGDAPVVAFFDMDRTLIRGYSVIAFLIEWLRGGRQGGRAIAREVLASIERRRGGRHYTHLYKNLLKGLAGVPVTEMHTLGEEAFIRHIEADIYREARQIIKLHRDLGHRIVIVSAATNFQIEPVARALGVDAYFGTALEQVEECLTGNVAGLLCVGEGKVVAARQYARTIGASLSDAWFYSDSRDDLPLLKKVGNPVATNPSAALEQYALERQWPVLEFCSRGKVSTKRVLRTLMTANTLATTAATGALTWLFSRSADRAANAMAACLGDIGAAFAGLELEVEGMQHPESVRPAIFVFNHQSYLDSIIVAHLLRHDFVAFCKSEVASNPLLGPLLKAHGTIFVDRSSQDQSVCLQQARTALESNKSLVIAPEGTRSSSGEVAEFKQGAFYLSRKMKVPIVPIVLHNAADALPKGKLLINPTTIRVTVLPPVSAADLGPLRQAGPNLRRHYQEVLVRSRSHCGAETVASTGGYIG